MPTQTVKFFGLDDAGNDQPLGTLVFDGRVIRPSPAVSLSAETFDDPHAAMLAEILATPIMLPMTGQVVTSRENPAEWLAGLRFTYKSSHLRATAPVNGP